MYHILELDDGQHVVVDSLDRSYLKCFNTRSEAMNYISYLRRIDKE